MLETANTEREKDTILQKQDMEKMRSEQTTLGINIKGLTTFFQSIFEKQDKVIVGLKEW